MRTNPSDATNFTPSATPAKPLTGRSAQVLRAIGCLVLSVTLAACSNDAELTPQTKADDVQVSGAVPRGVRVSILPAETSPVSPKIRPISRPVRIRSPRQPSGRVQIELPLSSRLPTGSEAIAAWRENEGGEWRIMNATVTPDRRTVVVQSRHFSDWMALGVDATAMWRDLKEQILDGLSSNIFAGATPPQCPNETAARADGYSIDSTHSDTIFWCLGSEGTRRILKVVNNRRYPLVIRHSGFEVIDDGSFRFSFEQLSQTLSSRQETVIFPRDTVVLAAGLGAGQTATLQTRFDGFGDSLYSLQVGVTSALAAFDKWGLKSSMSDDELWELASEIPECASAINSDTTSGDAVAKCMPGILKRAYGWKGAIVGVVIKVGELAEFFRRETTALRDIILDRTDYSITLKRTSQRPAPGSNAPTTPNLMPPVLNGWIVQWDGDTKAQKTAWIIGADSRRRWIPSADVYHCLKARNSPGPKVVPAAVLDQYPDLTGTHASCSAPAAEPVPRPQPPATPTTAAPSPSTGHRTWTEQVWSSSGAGTFRNYHNASGVGSRLARDQYIEVTCKVYDVTIRSALPGGYWYRIASAPFNNEYYAVANSFWNGDPPGGPYTHSFDAAVPDC